MFYGTISQAHGAYYYFVLNFLVEEMLLFNNLNMHALFIERKG